MQRGSSVGPTRAAILALLLATAPASSANAQQSPPASPAPATAQAPAPLPPGSPLLGRPDTDAAKKLAPVPPPPIPTAADKLPLDKLKVPAGYKLEVYMAGVPNVSVPGHGDPAFREHDDPPFQLMATHPTGVATQPVEGVSGIVG
jgi:hypothetical protein